jgi:hypothetical protein
MQRPRACRARPASQSTAGEDSDAARGHVSSYVPHLSLPFFEHVLLSHTKSFGNVTEPARLVYDWRYLSDRHDLANGAQIPEEAFFIP